jgi:hypothetical protein
MKLKDEIKGNVKFLVVIFIIISLIIFNQIRLSWNATDLKNCHKTLLDSIHVELLKMAECYKQRYKV